LFGIVYGVLYAYSESQRDRAWICTACERTKRPDAVHSCVCGGAFQDLLSVKWVEENKEEDKKRDR
jgi:hypothetical protein